MGSRANGFGLRELGIPIVHSDRFSEKVGIHYTSLSADSVSLKVTFALKPTLTLPVELSFTIILKDTLKHPLTLSRRKTLALHSVVVFYVFVDSVHE